MKQIKKNYLGIVLLVLGYISTCAANSLNMKGILSAPRTDNDALEQFKQAVAIRNFDFPADHLPHPEFKTEWWYFTGNLNTSDGAHFGYQFTLFRHALAKPKALTKPLLLGDEEDLEKPSEWRSKNIYMAHVALTDVSANKVFHRQAMNRDGLGLAGVSDADGVYKLWLNHWKLSSQQAQQWLPLELEIEDPEFSIKLQLKAAKPIILQGEQGLSQKSDKLGNASYYYSLTRMPSEGKIRVKQQEFSVQGNSWFDREWSTSSLAANQTGWDWFAIQLADGRDIMLYQLRLNNGVKDPNSYAVIVATDGQQTQFKAGQFDLQAKGYWQSPQSQINYPLSWELTIPSQQLQLSVKPFLNQQEWLGRFKYWEGAVKVEGSERQKSLSGVGYLEMTGYE